MAKDAKPAENLTENTFPKFAKFALIGDTIKWDKAGFSFTATLKNDDVTSVTDYDCYTRKDVADWKNDKWFYVGVVLSVSKNGIEILNHASSLWGLECNFPGSDNSYLSEVAQDMESEALDCAIIRRQEMIKALQD